MKRSGNAPLRVHSTTVHLRCTLRPTNRELFSPHPGQHAKRAIVSKDEGVLIALSSSFLRKQEPRSCRPSACRPWLPALRFAAAGMTSLERLRHVRGENFTATNRNAVA